MSFIRAPLAGDTPTTGTGNDELSANPIVVDAGIPGFRATIPLTTPARQQVATYAAIGVGFVLFLAGAAAFTYAINKGRKS